VKGVNSTDYLSLRISKTLKQGFNDFCKKKGLSASKALNLYVNRCIRDGVVPFRFGLSNMDGEDNSVRVSYHLESNIRQAFAVFCEKYEMPMSLFIRDFMNECVTRGDFPFDIVKVKGHYFLP